MGRGLNQEVGPRAVLKLAHDVKASVVSGSLISARWPLNESSSSSSAFKELCRPPICLLEDKLATSDSNLCCLIKEASSGFKEEGKEKHHPLQKNTRSKCKPAGEGRSQASSLPLHPIFNLSSLVQCVFSRCTPPPPSSLPAVILLQTQPWRTERRRGARGGR